MVPKRRWVISSKWREGVQGRSFSRQTMIQVTPGGGMHVERYREVTEVIGLVMGDLRVLRSIQ